MLFNDLLSTFTDNFLPISVSSAGAEFLQDDFSLVFLGYKRGTNSEIHFCFSFGFDLRGIYEHAARSIRIQCNQTSTLI